MKKVEGKKVKKGHIEGKKASRWMLIKLGLLIRSNAILCIFTAHRTI